MAAEEEPPKQPLRLFRRKELTLKDFDPKQEKLNAWEKVVNTDKHIVLENKETGMKADIYKVEKSYRVLFTDSVGSEPYDRTFEKPGDAIDAFVTMQGQLW